MTQVRFALIDRRLKSMNPLKKVDESMLGIKRRYFLEMIDVLVSASPVDTGNYVRSHSLSASRSGGMGVTNSHSLPRQQSIRSEQSAARAALQAAVSAFDENVRNVYIRNAAIYASRVEYQYGHAPYTKARDAASGILAGLVAEYRS